MKKKYIKFRICLREKKMRRNQLIVSSITVFIKLVKTKIFLFMKIFAIAKPWKITKFYFA